MSATASSVKTGIALLLFMLAVVRHAECWEENGRGVKPDSELKKKDEGRSHTAGEGDSTADSGKVEVPEYCSPVLHVQPNGTYDYHIRDLYQAYIHNYTSQQQRTEELCDGELSFGLSTPTRFSEEEEDLYSTEVCSDSSDLTTCALRRFLVTNWVVAKVCIQPLQETDCAITIGIVELVKTNKAVLFYEQGAQYHPGVMLLESNLYRSTLGYVLNSVQAPLENQQPFLNLSPAHASFVTPCTYNSSLILLAQIPELRNLTCNYQVEIGTHAPPMNYSSLNHTEFLIEKIVLIVSLDNNQTIKTIPLGVRFQFWVSLNVSCSTGRVRVTSFQMWNETEFLNETQIAAANYTGILQQMSDEGWGEYWRSPLDQPIALRHRCTLDPTQSGGQLPECFHLNFDPSRPESIDEDLTSTRDEL